ncbi:Protein of unknown function [Gryllus bimaculatus]|nr:Protein of unknown function [Gryllus bimaculatus]
MAYVNSIRLINTRMAWTPVHFLLATTCAAIWAGLSPCEAFDRQRSSLPFSVNAVMMGMQFHQAKLNDLDARFKALEAQLQALQDVVSAPPPPPPPPPRSSPALPGRRTRPKGVVPEPGHGGDDAKRALLCPRAAAARTNDLAAAGGAAPRRAPLGRATLRATTRCTVRREGRQGDALAAVAAAPRPRPRG